MLYAQFNKFLIFGGIMKKSYIKNLGLLFLLLMSAVGLSGNSCNYSVKNPKPGVAERLSLIGAGFSAVGGLLYLFGDGKDSMVANIGKAIGLGGAGALSAGVIATIYNYMHDISSASKDQIKQFLAESNDKVLVQRGLAGLRALLTIAGYNVFAKIVDRNCEGNRSLAITALGIGSYCAFDVYRNLEYVKTTFEEIVNSQNEEIAESQKQA